MHGCNERECSRSRVMKDVQHGKKNKKWHTGRTWMTRLVVWMKEEPAWRLARGGEGTGGGSWRGEGAAPGGGFMV